MESSQERKLYIPVGHGELHPAVRVEVVRSVLWPVGIVGLCGYVHVEQTFLMDNASPVGNFDICFINLI